MNKKKRLLFTFILSCIFTFAGTLMKLTHLPYANVCLGIGIFTGFFVLYLLISFLVKAKE